MSLEPTPAGEAASGPVPVPEPQYRWYHKVSALLFIIFCMELGLFLVIVPWTESWDSNFFSALVPEWHGYWTNAYVRGAVSGVGVLNLYISFLEIFQLRRFAKGR
ncbi:MAG TPA: hypothetical protein VN442_12085 [Bryobacteraceae bacterium]|nr:hypothetical protein [Bryobacteraceae bacterium]